jgi:hypothetical protein
MCPRCIQVGKMCLDTADTHPVLHLLTETRPSREEYLCKPENMAGLFEYQFQNGKYSVHTVVSAAEFTVKDTKTDMGIVLQRDRYGTEVKVLLNLKHFQQVIRSIPFYKSLGVNVGSSYIDIEPPYAIFFHHLKDMRKRQKNSPRLLLLTKRTF